MNEKINENLKPPMSEIEAKLNNLDIQNVSIPEGELCEDSEEYPCYACQGGGCPVCNGFGTLTQ
jgi:hypothetical protein